MTGYHPGSLEYAFAGLPEGSMELAQKLWYHDRISNELQSLLTRVRGTAITPDFCYMVICRNCGVECKRRSNEIQSRFLKRRYCSHVCAGVARRNRIICYCFVCKKEFYRIKAEYEKYKDHFCSMRCRKTVLPSITPRGEKNHMWKGDSVGYWGLHGRMYRRVPKPNKCAICKENKPKELSNKSQQYRTTTDDWWWLCVACHRKYDAECRPHPTIACAQCGVVFRRIRRIRQFCSMKCSSAMQSKLRLNVPTGRKKYSFSKNDMINLLNGTVSQGTIAKKYGCDPKTVGAHYNKFIREHPNLK